MNDLAAASSLECLGVVAIGRNEGARLARCLASIPTGVGRVVYVDSGSTDGSVELARARGADVVELDASLPFTAARARNLGFAFLQEHAPGISVVQFVDGDCELIPGWLERALSELAGRPDFAAACGYRREFHPESSLFNRICDMEWRTPPAGEIPAFGGDVAIRAEALRAVGGYDASVIAAEDDELCIRLRKNGWKLLRVDAPMTLHDADMQRLSQWWNRALRCGHAIAEISWRHPAAEGGHFGRRAARTLAWGLLLPGFAIGACVVTRGLSLLALGLLPLQAIRIAVSLLRQGHAPADAWVWAVSCVASKPAEGIGMLRFHARRLLGSPARIIEYKRNPR